MTIFALRVSLPDRPGALGAVASRIAAVRADVVGIEILERHVDRAIDEFIVELPDTEDDLMPLLLSEINEVDGVVVEEVHLLADGARDGRLDAFETAAALLRQSTPEGVLDMLAERVQREHATTWAAVVDTEGGAILASVGRPPAPAWLAAYVDGTRWQQIVGQVGNDRHIAASDVAWVDLAAWDVVLAVGRPGWPFREHERRHLAALANLADARWADLADREAREAHPARDSHHHPARAVS
jgi:hypothetical protein